MLGLAVVDRLLALQMKTDDADRRQRAKQYWPIRQASNKELYVKNLFHINCMNGCYACYKNWVISYFHEIWHSLQKKCLGDYSKETCMSSLSCISA